MRRSLACIAAVLALAGCDADDATGLRQRLADRTERVDELTRAVERERKRVDELNRELADRPEIDAVRFVDLYTGGPTIGGDFLALPRLGTMSWSCDEDHGFRIVFEVSAATLRVEYDLPGATPGRDATVHPGQTVGATLQAGETVTWRITHRHKPGFIRAEVAVTPARSRHGGCLLADVRLEETGRLYD